MLELFKVRGHSMIPAILPGALVLVNKLVFLFRSPRAGEIVVAYDDFSGIYVIKRLERRTKNGFVLRGDYHGETYMTVPKEKILGKVMGKR